MRPLILASGLFLVALVAGGPLGLTDVSMAHAQMGDPPPPADPNAGDAAGDAGEKKEEPEEPSDPSLFEGENPGEDENPGDPRIDLVGKKPDVVKEAVVRPPGYPQEVILRPLTLPGGMAQASFEYRLQTAPQGNGILGVNYAITSQVQVGLRYGIGTLYDDGYEPGKTFSIDAEYTIFDWLAAQLSVPMLADPYTVGVTLGAPMKFSFRDKLRFDLFRDLVTFRTNRDFYPRIGNALVTEAQVALDETNTTLPQGEIRIAGSVIYQHDVKMAAEARLGLTMNDFELTSDSPYLLEVGGTYAHSQKIDVGGFLGFTDLGNAGDTFGLMLFTRLRI